MAQNREYLPPQGRYRPCQPAQRPEIGLLLVGFLAACGGGSDAAAGGGGGGAGGGVSVSPPATSIACALTACEIAKLAYTASMPSGSATYSGRASISTQNAQGAVFTTNADLGMSVNFSARNLTVSLTNIETTAGQVAGSATGSGIISGNGLTAAYGGAIAGTMSGNFRGTNAAALMGDITLAGGGGTGGDAFGQFYGNRQ